MKFLASLIGISISSAAAVATARTKSGALAKGDAANPWLSLLTQSWALPGEPQAEQSKGLDGLADSIVKLARSQKSGAPDESMQAAIESIKAILSDMKDSVTAGNSAGQKEIFEKQAAVQGCASPNVTEKVSWKAGLHVTHEMVVECRMEEKTYYDKYEACKAEEARCSNTTECCAEVIQPSAYCLNPPVGPSPLSLETSCDGASKCREKDLQNKLGFFEAKLAEYNDAYEACEKSRTGCNATYSCPNFRTKWEEKRKICNSKQTTFEQAYCDLATQVESTWETYTTCYVHNKQVLVSTENKQDGLLGTRRQEWRGLERIACLLSALTATDKEAALEACLKKDFTAKANATLNISFPSREGNVTAMGVCGETIESPGTEYFMKTYYGLLPPVLIPDTLTTYHCVSGVATSHCPIKSSPVALLAKAHLMPHAHLGHLAHA
mmetsp:Transcript_38870/g.72269  ORF Transcript_38870/g.72269 Transcript_38870/m.72269 type:complete len:439 (+) Transcript_38870:60-1376(+)